MTREVQYLGDIMIKGVIVLRIVDDLLQAE